MINVFTRRIIQYIGCISIIVLLFGGEVPAKEKSAQMEVTFRIVLTEKKCQMAIWLVDEKGAFIDTVYVTRKIAKKGLGNRGGGIDDKLGGSRLSVLPVWAHQRGINYGGDNFYPTKDRPLVDAITSATPKKGEFVWLWQPKETLPPGKYNYYIEINKSFDDNKHHDYSWYRGQPSVIWRGSIDIGGQISQSEARIIGHGHVAGIDGKIDPDLSTLTTAINLIENAGAVYQPIKD